MNELTEIEKTASPSRALGLQTIFAMKANAYGLSIDEGRLMTLDCFLLIGDYDESELTDEEKNSEWRIKSIECDRKRVEDQADFVGNHLVQWLKDNKVKYEN